MNEVNVERCVRALFVLEIKYTFGSATNTQYRTKNEMTDARGEKHETNRQFTVESRPKSLET